MSFNAGLVKASQSTVVALASVTANTFTGGPVLNVSGALNPESGSLAANVSVGCTTSTIVIKTVWQGSNDNVTWNTIFAQNSPASVAVAAAGTGSLVTTAYIHSCPINPMYPYMRLAVQNTVATGGAGDNVTVSYNWKKRVYT